MADDVASPVAQAESPLEAVVGGNRLLLLETGEGRLRALLDLIAGAQTSVRILFYIFNSDWAGRLVRDASHWIAVPSICRATSSSGSSRRPSSETRAPAA